MPDWPNHGITSTETFSDGISTENTYLELIASTAAPVKWIRFSGCASQASAENEFTFYLATGAGGSEVVRGIAVANIMTTAALDNHAIPILIYVEMDLPTGTRVAVKYDDIGGTITCRLTAAVTVGEKAA